MSFKVSDNKLLKKVYPNMAQKLEFYWIWNLIVRLFMVIMINIMTKIKIYDDNVYTNFQGNKVPKENASYKCF